MNIIHGFVFYLILAIVCEGATLRSTTGNSSDVQATVNAAQSGDTVVVPAGNFVWTNALVLSKSITLQGAGADSTVVSRDSGITYQGELVSISPSADVPVRVTGMRFNSVHVGGGYHRLPGVAIWGTSLGLTQIRIDNCYFDAGEDAVEWNLRAYGVVDSCTFHNCTYGVVAYADGDYDWSRPIVYGSSNAGYVEDCTFQFDSGMPGFDTVVDVNRGGRLVFRHCNFDLSAFPGYNFGSIWMTHGNQAFWTGNPSSDNTRAGLLLEVYNNNITVNQGYRITYLRGGRALVYNNSFTFLNSSPPIVTMTEEEGYDSRWFSTFRTAWPAEDQVNNSFFWGNTINGRAQAASDFAMENSTDTIFFHEGRDYWLQQPGSSTVTAYPHPGSPSSPNYPVNTYYAPVTSYTAFPYPHPLRSGANPPPNPTPNPPTNLRVAGSS